MKLTILCQNGEVRGLKSHRIRAHVLTFNYSNTNLDDQLCTSWDARMSIRVGVITSGVITWNGVERERERG